MLTVVNHTHIYSLYLFRAGKALRTTLTKPLREPAISLIR